MKMLSLGIESTAHTFGCSIIKHCSDYRHTSDNEFILSEIRDIYKASAGWGIHPKDASKHHAMVASRILKDCLRESKVNIKDIDIVSYSAGPGLGPCLRIGAVVSRALASYHNKPLVPVNHALGHLELGIKLCNLDSPLTLLVSGGHTMLLVYHKNKWRVFGETLDITLGQLFDQVGRKIGFASPCGNKIEDVANLSKRNVLYPLPYIIKGNDVSFSGLLSSVKKLLDEKHIDMSDICFSLQETAFAIIVEAVERALAFTENKEFLIVGGVSANKRLSDMLQIACKSHNCAFNSCPLRYCGDNAAQIAWTGAQMYFSNPSFAIKPENATVDQSWRLDGVFVPWR
jgi:N6-L-threonylcarbamoyladenine synthase